MVRSSAAVYLLAAAAEEPAVEAFRYLAVRMGREVAATRFSVPWPHRMRTQAMKHTPVLRHARAFDHVAASELRGPAVCALSMRIASRPAEESARGSTATLRKPVRHNLELNALAVLFRWPLQQQDVELDCAPQRLFRHEPEGHIRSQASNNE